MKRSNIFAVMTRARRMFARQLIVTQNLDTKIACIQEVANGVYADPQRVWYDLLTEAKRLTNLIDFNEYCRALRLNPAHVAQHIVFEGSGIVNKVMRYGVEQVIGERIRMFEKPLYDQTKIKGLIAVRSQIEDAEPVAFSMPSPEKFLPILSTTSTSSRKSLARMAAHMPLKPHPTTSRSVVYSYPLGSFMMSSGS